jgi:hypothetical protein
LGVSNAGEIRRTPKCVSEMDPMPV